MQIQPRSVNVSLAPTFSLQRALLATVAVAVLAGLVPAGVALNRRLANALESRARVDLSLAGRVLADRSARNADMLMMVAKDFAHADGLADALATNNRDATLALVERARPTLGSVPIVIGADGKSWTGPEVDSVLVSQTRSGKMPVVVRRSGMLLQNIALAPVMQGDRWVGAVGLLSPFDAGAAGVLSGLTRSDVVILSSDDGMLAATTLDSVTTRELIAGALRQSVRNAESSETHELLAGGQRRLVVAARLGDAGVVLFTRSLADELAVLPELQRLAFVTAVAALLIALIMGSLLAARVARPVQELSAAAAAITEGEFSAPLPHSRIREVKRVAETFDVMRQALAQRLSELKGMNEALTDRNARLSALQADLMQRDRLTATGRLVAQLAHEIRNPVANLRNCLEIIRQRSEQDAESLEFVDLAIDELLRMHELAEQMLDFNRPRSAGLSTCNPLVVANEVAKLSNVGQKDSDVIVISRFAQTPDVVLTPDTLKQVLLNLIQNAREAVAPHVGGNKEHAGKSIEIVIAGTDAHMLHIDVCDNGPGIPGEIANRIFDPFFTTKEAVHGVGLGLFVAEGLIRTAGGRLSFFNREEHDASGAVFRLLVPIAIPAVVDSPAITDDPSSPSRSQLAAIS